MYPRNAASPERIAVGAVVQISDGAVQTSGVSIKVKPQGAGASAGGGTTSYEEGIVAYVPTQAETDYTSFQVIAYKTGCIPVAQTIVTSASATAGQTVLEDGSLTAAKIASDAITAAKLHSDVTTELQSGLATAANLATVAGYLDTEIAAILADTNELQTDWADGGRLDLILDARASQTSVDDIPTNSELATALAAADDAVLAQIALVKATTDSFTFTVAGQVDANIQYVNDVAVQGDGQSGTEWGPA